MAKVTIGNPHALSGDEQQVLCYVFAMCAVSRAKAARDLNGRCNAEEGFDRLVERGFLTVAQMDYTGDMEFEVSDTGLDALNETELH